MPAIRSVVVPADRLGFQAGKCAALVVNACTLQQRRHSWRQAINEMMLTSQHASLMLLRPDTLHLLCRSSSAIWTPVSQR